MQSSVEEIILHVGAEGGDIILKGKRATLGWQYRVNVDDETPTLLGEGLISKESKPVTSWQEAIALLDVYPWAKLHPLVVHPEFKKIVLVAAIERLRDSPHENRRENWRQICSDRETRV